MLIQSGELRGRGSEHWTVVFDVLNSLVRTGDFHTAPLIWDALQATVMPYELSTANFSLCLHFLSRFTSSRAPDVVVQSGAAAALASGLVAAAVAHRKAETARQVEAARQARAAKAAVGSGPSSSSGGSSGGGGNGAGSAAGGGARSHRGSDGSPGPRARKASPGISSSAEVLLQRQLAAQMAQQSAPKLRALSACAAMNMMQRMKESLHAGWCQPPQQAVAPTADTTTAPSAGSAAQDGSTAGSGDGSAGPDAAGGSANASQTTPHRPHTGDDRDSDQPVALGSVETAPKEAPRVQGTSGNGGLRFLAGSPTCAICLGATVAQWTSTGCCCYRRWVE